MKKRRKFWRNFWMTLLLIFDFGQMRRRSDEVKEWWHLWVHLTIFLLVEFVLCLFMGVGILAFENVKERFDNIHLFVLATLGNFFLNLILFVIAFFIVLYKKRKTHRLRDTLNLFEKYKKNVLKEDYY